MRKEILILHDLDNQKSSIQNQLECGIMNSVDATNEINLINRKEIKLKEKLVFEKHISKDGHPRKISFMESKGLYSTKMANGSKLTAKSREALIEKLFSFYELTIMDTTIKGIFERALDEKQRTENVQLRTIDRISSDFNYCINDDFSKRDIRTITKADLKEYTQSMVQRLNPTDKRFKAYKSILNLIFRYAIEYDVIALNPVESIKNAVYKKSCRPESHKAEENILSVDDIELIKSEVEERMTQPRYNGYFICGFIILLAIETGMRAGELCALKWSDVSFESIHIHAQQLFEKRNGVKTFYYAEWTKDEKGISKGGRLFPLTDSINDLLKRLSLIQRSKGIQSDYIFCDENGDWIKSNRYTACLQRLMKSLGYSVTNNHAFRKSLNSNVFIPLGIPVTDRARLLGHSVETNLRNYSYARLGVENDIRTLLNQQVTPRSPQNVVDFTNFAKEKSLTNRKFARLS